MVTDICIEDFDYELPAEKIAKYPLAARNDSKLLVCTESTGYSPKEARFVDIVDYLPEKGVMIFNNTKVVPARIIFSKDTGSHVEVFCLEPDTPSDYQLCFASTQKCRWKCIIGNLRRWKSGLLTLHLEGDVTLTAELISFDGRDAVVEFVWNGFLAFSKIIEMAGRIPIPPYLNRDTEEIDITRYQTYYALREGSVAAPTAGLHFTARELENIDRKGLKRENVCLHVGAGTFLPVKSKTIGEHAMHTEPFSVSRTLLETLVSNAGNPVIAVGTTSTRCLESLYFLGVHCIETGHPRIVTQWEPYRESGYAYSLEESLGALHEYMKRENMEELISRTGIIIAPGYKARVCDYLVTNFHQPKSTLLLLISAFIGDRWRENYRFALENGFRFLSYGDSSLLQVDRPCADSEKD